MVAIVAFVVVVVDVVLIAVALAVVVVILAIAVTFVVAVVVIFLGSFSVVFSIVAVGVLNSYKISNKIADVILIIYGTPFAAFSRPCLRW